MTYRAQQVSTWLYLWRGSRERRSVGRSRPQRAIYYRDAIVAKENWRTATRNRAPACPPTPPGALRTRARADGAAYQGVGGGKVRSAIKNVGERHANLRVTGCVRRDAHDGEGMLVFYALLL